MYFVYVLKSVRDGRLYTGSTDNLERRLHEHNRGYTASTAKRRPFVLIHREEYSTKEAASTRERFLKSGQGRKLLKELLGSSP